MTVALRQRPLAQVVNSIVKAGNGCWLDPSDMSTMFQDAAGTIPVTAVEQPVGLMLDKSQGLMLGPELVTNGTFDTDISGWGSSSAGSTLTWVSASIRVTSDSGGFDDAQQLLTTIPGKFYIATCKKLQGGGSAGKLRIVASSGAELSRSPYSSSVQTNLQTVFKATSSISAVQVFVDTANSYADFDNISVRELYGNHATQSITASRPTLSARKNVLLATEMLATQSVTTIEAQYTLSFTGTGSVTLSGTATGTLTGTGAANCVSLTVTPTAGTLTLTVSGVVTKAQLELGAVAGPYQRVNTATDYDTNPALFPKYLKFDGVDDYLNLPYMGLYANGSCSTIAGVSMFKVISATVNEYLLTERSTISESPVYIVQRRCSSAGGLSSLIRNDIWVVLADEPQIAFSPADARVVTTIDNGTSITSIINSTPKIVTNYTRAGTLTLNSTTIGASVSTTTGGYASMKLYGLIITKSTLTDAQRIKCERFLARKAGVML